MVEQGRRETDGTQGTWLVRLAIIAATMGLYATIVDEVAAGIVLYVAAIGALSIFYRKYTRPFYRRYVKPLQGLSEKLDKISERQVEIQEQIEEVKEQAKEQAGQEAKQLGRIERGAEIAAERADAAINVAEAVRRQLGVAVRGDGSDEPRE